MTSTNDIVFYVASNGSDNWSGQLSSPNRSETDGPFASVHGARDAIRELKGEHGGKLPQAVTVFVRDGIYVLDEPIIFTAEDSGTEECPVTFAAYRDENPIISGGKSITGWKQVTVNGKQMWAAEIDEVREGRWFFRNLWVNGQRRIRARHPNQGYLKIAEVPDVTPEMQWHEGQTRFQFHEGDMEAWKTAGDAEVVAMTRWVESHLPIKNVDETEHMVEFDKRSVFRLESGDQYYVEHALELLDVPGEWYLNRKTGTLYYMPMPDEDMGKAEVIAPVLEQIVRFEGKPEAGEFVEHLAFRGLTFSHTEWYFPEGYQSQWPKPDVGGFSQAAIGVPGSIYGEGVRQCVFEGCTLAHFGAYGIELSRGCKNNRIASSDIFDLGAGGVRIGETVIRDDESEQTHDNEIIDCRICEGGLFYHSGIGVWIGQSYNNRIIHNDIHDFYYTGISVGWTWGYGPALARGNIVESNHIHHIGIRSNGDGPILSDMGGIYTLGMQPGTVVRGNIFHDTAGFRYGGWGIYFDEGSTHIVAENNIVYRTTNGGFHQHYGRENVVRNNILVLARDSQVQRTRPEEHVSFTFERNVVYWREGDMLSGNLGNFNIAFDHNLYYCEDDGKMQFGNLSWDEWRAKGMDENSMIADPLFVAPEKDDFHLKPDSPAFKIGFVQFNLSKVGKRK